MKLKRHQLKFEIPYQEGRIVGTSVGLLIDY